jgi:hypothetical protein
VTDDTRRLRDETEVEGWSHSGWSYWMIITGLTTIRRMLNESSCIRHKTKVLPRKIPKRKQPQSVLYRTGDENTPIADTSVQLCKLHFGRCPITMNTDQLLDF